MATIGFAVSTVLCMAAFTLVLRALADWLFWGMRLTGRQCLGAVTVLLGLAVLLYVERPSPEFHN